MNSRLESAANSSRVGLIIHRKTNSELYIIPRKVGGCPIRIKIVEVGAGGVRLGINATEDYLIIRDNHIDSHREDPKYAGLISALQNSEPLTEEMLYQLYELRG